jgi:hypothetical protein
MFIYNPSSDWHKRQDMTIGKIYKGKCIDEMTYSSDGIYYQVINDKDICIEIHENHLIELNKYRNTKLDKLFT